MGKYLVWVMLSVVLVACSQEDWLRKVASPEEQRVAQTYIEQLRSRDYAEIEKSIDPSLAGQLQGGVLSQMADLIPAGSPTSVKLVGANRFSSSAAGTTLNLTFEYEFDRQFLLINVATKARNGATTIVGFRVLPEAASLDTQNSFTLAGKGAVQYGALAASIAATLFTLVVLVICIRTKMQRRKWPWILFIVFGFGKFAVNWTTGEWGVTVLSAQLFSASTTASFHGPWIVAVSLPIGAMTFLMKRKSLRIATLAS